MEIFEFEDRFKEKLLEKKDKLTQKQINEIRTGIETLKEITTIQDLQRSLLRKEL